MYKLERQKNRYKVINALLHDYINLLSAKRNNNLFTYSPINLLTSDFAFTMAEILISLTIIGVIAAITLPSLRANINEKAWATQRKALYSRMSQAISMMPSLNGYGIGANDTETASKAALAFITDGLSKVLKINNICDNSNLGKCGFPDKIRKLGNGAPKIDTPKKLTELNNMFSAYYSPLDTSAAAFETHNGESILTFYNPVCRYGGSAADYTQLMMCANFVYDLNGKKGPNQVGKDIGFIAAFYPTDTEVVMPYPVGHNYVSSNTNPEFSVSIGNKTCRKKFGTETKMANIEELKTIWINNNLGYRNSNGSVFLLPTIVISSTVINGKMYGFHAGADRAKILKYDVTTYTDGPYNNIYCVK